MLLSVSVITLSIATIFIAINQILITRRLKEQCRRLLILQRQLQQQKQ